MISILITVSNTCDNHNVLDKKLSIYCFYMWLVFFWNVGNTKWTITVIEVFLKVGTSNMKNTLNTIDIERIDYSYVKLGIELAELKYGL